MAQRASFLREALPAAKLQRFQRCRVLHCLRFRLRFLLLLFSLLAIIVASLNIVVEVAGIIIVETIASVIDGLSWWQLLVQLRASNFTYLLY